MARPTRAAHERLVTDALLLRSVPYRDSDLVVTLFTEAAGRLSAIARGGRRSQRRFVALEPLHLLRVEAEIAPGRELATLVEARIERPRIALTSSLAAMDRAGRGLRWLRTLAAAGHPEPVLWQQVNALLDGLEGGAAADASVPDEGLLAAAGLRMLGAAGWALELRRCVRCDTPCPERARVTVDPAAGGVVCRACGGRGVTLGSRQRHALLAAAEGDPAAIGDVATLAIDVVERTIAVHSREEAT